MGAAYSTDDQKRLMEYQQLKKDLQDISFQAANTPNEYDSAMQYPDTDNVMQSRNAARNFINLLFRRIGHMLSPRPCVGNFISLFLVIGILVMIRAEIITKIGSYNVEKYLPYIGYASLIVGAITIIKSGTRSLLIPLLAVVIGGIVATTIQPHELILTFQKAVYQGMFVVGLIGLVIAAFSID